MSDTFTLGSTTDLTTDINLAPQCRRILSHLRRGKTITNNESMLVYGIYRLSDVINKLRNKGYDIETELKRDEVGRRYSSYSLIP